MPIIIPALAVIALLFLFKKPVGGISRSASHTTIPVMLGDDVTVAQGLTAGWHETADQEQLFGPIFPSYWNMNGYFMFDNGRGGYNHYKPDWQVFVKSRFS